LIIYNNEKKEKGKKEKEKEREKERELERTTVGNKKQNKQKK
jgi:hypothetical protein